jgi:hypothetical protein
MKMKKPKNKKLAGMYGNPNVVTRGDIITAAKKNKNKKKKNVTRKKSTLA